VANLTVYFKQTPDMSDYLQSFSYKANIRTSGLCGLQTALHYSQVRNRHCLKSVTYSHTVILFPILERNGFIIVFLSMWNDYWSNSVCPSVLL